MKLQTQKKGYGFSWSTYFGRRVGKLLFAIGFLSLMGFSGLAMAQQKVLILATAASNPDGQDLINNVQTEFENHVGVGNVTVQKILQTPGAVSAATFTAAPGPYDAVVLATAYEAVDASNWVAIREAISQRRAKLFIMFVDGCCQVGFNAAGLRDTINDATGLTVSLGLSSAGLLDFPLNTSEPIATSFTGLNPLQGGYTTYLNNVPVGNALYMNPGFVPPAASSTVNNVYGSFFPRSQSYGGAGACFFGVIDLTMFSNGENGVNPYAFNRGKVASAFMASIDPVTGSCTAGGLRITKTLVDPPPGGAPGNYDFSVSCNTPTATYTGTVTLEADETSGEIDISIDEDSTNCVVTETAQPNAPAGTQWQSPVITQPPSPLQAIGAAAEVRNPLVKTLRVNKSLTLPAGVSGPFAFEFNATCDLPAAGTVYGPVTLSNFPTNTSVDITGVPAAANCTLAETLPTAPDGWSWSAPVVGAWSSVAEGQAATVTNALTRTPSPSVSKAVLSGPTAVAGNPMQHDISYRITVSSIAAAVTSYSLSDTLGFDPDLSVVGTPLVTPGGGAGPVNTGFTGSGANTSLVSNQTLAASGVHTFDIEVRVQKNAFNDANNTCSGAAGNGLFNSTTLSWGSDQQTASACADTPQENVNLIISKAAKTKTATIGGFVRYEITVENPSGPDANNFNLVDRPAPGLSYVAGTVRVVGDDSYNVTSEYPLTISGLNLAERGKLTISYMMRVGASAGQGQLENCAQVGDASSAITSNRSCASITRTSDPDFEDSRILGTVFEDSNGNGMQDDGEPGIPGVRLATVEGLLIETDAYGRYHIEGINPGQWARGSNFIVKVDVATIPEGAVSTTQNPLVKRLTQGLPGLFNFGFRVPFSTYEPGKPLSYPVMLSADGLFEFDRFDLLDAGRKKLTDLAKHLLEDSKTQKGLKVSAYTDRLGSAAYNQKLSTKRAETIKAFLVSQGIDESLITIEGMGAAKPLVNCPGNKSAATIACLAPNRRFEVSLP